MEPHAELPAPDYPFKQVSTDRWLVSRQLVSYLDEIFFGTASLGGWWAAQSSTVAELQRELHST